MTRTSYIRQTTVMNSTLILLLCVLLYVAPVYAADAIQKENVS